MIGADSNHQSIITDDSTRPRSYQLIDIKRHLGMNCFWGAIGYRQFTNESCLNHRHLAPVVGLDQGKTHKG